MYRPRQEKSTKNTSKQKQVSHILFLQFNFNAIEKKTNKNDYKVILKVQEPVWVAYHNATQLLSLVASSDDIGFVLLFCLCLDNETFSEIHANS